MSIYGNEPAVAKCAEEIGESITKSLMQLGPSIQKKFKVDDTEFFIAIAYGCLMNTVTTFGRAAKLTEPERMEVSSTFKRILETIWNDRFPPPPSKACG